MVVGSLRTTSGVVVARGEKVLVIIGGSVVTAVAVVTRVVVILSCMVVVGRVGSFVVV